MPLAPPCTFDTEGEPHTVAQRWKVWSRRFESYVLASGIKDEKQAQEILLYSAGEEIHNLVDDNNIKRGGTARELAHNIQAHLDKKNSIVFLRYMFETCRPLESEVIDAWYARLKKTGRALPI